MIANPFQSFMSSLQAPKMSRPTPAQQASFQAVASSSPSATAPKAAALSTPAAQQYVSSQLGSNTPDVAGNQAAAARMGITIPGVGGGDTLGGANAPTQSDPYMTYLSSLFNPEQLKTSKGLIDSYGSKINDATNSLYGIQNEQLSRKVSGAHDYQNTLDESGGLLGGAQQSAAMSARRSNAELADLAVQESAKANTLSALTGARKNAQDTYDQMIGAGRSVYEAKQAADKVAADTARAEQSGRYKTIGDGTQLYDTTTGKIVAENTKTYAPSKGTTVSGTPSGANLAAGEAKLRESMGPDGYVNPVVYQQAYDQWPGTTATFLSKFPPKNYVNPANDWLPAILRPKSASSRSI